MDGGIHVLPVVTEHAKSPMTSFCHDNDITEATKMTTNVNLCIHHLLPRGSTSGHPRGIVFRDKRFKSSG